MADPSAAGAVGVREETPQSREPARIMRAAGLLLIGRQVGGAAFTAAFFVVSAISGSPVVDQLLWSWFAVLFLSSVLNFGLERAMAILVGRADGSPGSGAGSLMRLRFLSLPITAAGVYGLFAVTRVYMPLAASAATVVWVSAVQVQGVAFAWLRAERNARFEPVAALVGRGVQCLILLGLVGAGAPVAPVVATLALVDVVVAVAAWAASRHQGRSAGGGWREQMAWSDLAMFTAIELFAFAYLRADTVIAGHLLGSRPGATYSLAYRVMDGMTGLATPLLLVVFPAAARMVAQGRSLTPMRIRARKLVPVIGGGLALVAILGTVPLAALVPRMHEASTALRLLLATVPLYFYSAFELHLLSAEGENRPVAQLGAALLVLNVALNIVLIPRFGLTGAGWALVVTELVQVAWTVGRGTRQQPTVISGTAPLLATVSLLLGVGLLLDIHHVGAAAAIAACFAIAAIRSVMTRTVTGGVA